MIAQPNFNAKGPVEFSGSIFSSSSGDLGSSSKRFTNLYLNGAASVNQINASTGEITGLFISNLYPVGIPNLGHPSQKWNNSYITGTGYSYSQQVIFNGQSEEVLTRAEFTGKFPHKKVTAGQLISYSSGIVSGLHFDMAANQTYKFEYNVRYSGSDSSEGINLCFSGTSPSTFAAGSVLINDSSSSIKNFPIMGYLELVSNGQGSASNTNILCDLLVSNGSSPSTLYLIAGKETTGVSPYLSVNSGSWATMSQYF